MKIIIKNLKFKAIIGILDFERKNPQEIVIDLELKYSGEFIDYSHIRKFIIKLIKKSKFNLLEDAIKSIKNGIKKNYFNVSKLKIKISKPNIFDDCIVAVEEKYNF